MNINPPVPRITLQSGDHLVVSYVDPFGRTNTLEIDAQHLVLIVNHVETDAAMVIRPIVGVQYLPGSK